MPFANEQSLLADYVADRNDSSFRGLVELHIKMVFGCAVRRTGDAGMAEEISQNVFAILARKAHRLKLGTGLAGWLHQTTLYESQKALRTERRHRRKMKLLADHSLAQSNDVSDPSDVIPRVDEAISELAAGDQQVILWHFFEGRSFREISHQLGKSEAASQKQTSRAVGKLAQILKRRGVVATAASLVPILATESAKAAPTGIAEFVSAAAIANAPSITTSTLIANTIQTMTYAKTKIAVLVAATAAVPIGAQMHSIDKLKHEVEAFEARESEFTRRGERVAELEEKFASLPPEFAAWATDPAARNSGAPVLSATRTASGISGLAGIRPSNTKKKAASPETVDDPEPAEANANPFGSLKEMMKDPLMRKMVEQQMEAQILVTYGDFFQYLGLDETQTADLSSALLERQLGIAELGMDAVKGNGGKVDGAASDELNSAMSVHDEEIESLLGEEKFAELERFEKSTAERQELKAFREVLEGRGGDLPFETEQELMAIMYEENHAPEPGELEYDDTDATLAYLRAVQGKIRQRASDVLTGEQLEAFAANQESYLKLIETGLRAQGGMGDLFGK